MSEIPHPSPFPPQPLPSQNDKTIYAHHFNYLINNVEDDIELYKEKYSQIVGLKPEIMKFKDKNLIYVKIQTDKKIIHNINIIRELNNYGMELKLSSQQLDKNAVFCLGIPAGFTKIKKDKLISALNTSHPDLKIMDIYILPLKNREQNITSIKISFATQAMVNSAMRTGLKLMDHTITISKINRAKILGSPQCMKCYDYTHQTYKCKSNIKCLHCSGEHVYKNCPNKSKSPTCANCLGGHKPNSNRCPTRKNYLIIPKTDSDPDTKVVLNPESSIKEINGPVTYKNQTSPSFPNVSYSDCLDMALKFNDWRKAYIEIQKSFGLKVIQIPDTIVNDIRSDLLPSKTTETNEKQTKVKPINDPNKEPKIAPTVVPTPSTSVKQKDITFHPLPSNHIKPSPKTRKQKETHKNKNKIEMVQNRKKGNILKNLNNVCNNDSQLNEITNMDQKL